MDDSRVIEIVRRILSDELLTTFLRVRGVGVDKLRGGESEGQVIGSVTAADGEQTAAWVDSAGGGDESLTFFMGVH